MTLMTLRMCCRDFSKCTNLHARFLTRSDCLPRLPPRDLPTCSRYHLHFLRTLHPPAQLHIHIRELLRAAQLLLPAGFVDTAPAPTDL